MSRLTPSRAFACLELRRDLLARVRAMTWPPASDLLGLQAVLDARAALLAEVAALADLADVRALAADRDGRLAPRDRERVARLVEESRTLTREILEADARVRIALEAERAVARSGLERAEHGKSVVRAYTERAA